MITAKIQGLDGTLAHQSAKTLVSLVKPYVKQGKKVEFFDEKGQPHTQAAELLAKTTQGMKKPYEPDLAAQYNLTVVSTHCEELAKTIMKRAISEEEKKKLERELQALVEILFPLDPESL